MAFIIEIAHTLRGAVRHRLVDLVGDAALRDGPGWVTVAVDDQAAMLGVARRLNDLGLTIDRIERVPRG